MIDDSDNFCMHRTDACYLEDRTFQDFLFHFLLFPLSILQGKHMTDRSTIQLVRALLIILFLLLRLMLWVVEDRQLTNE